MKEKARKPAPKKNADSKKDSKEIAAARLSTRTTIIVAVIGMVSAIVVAIIANSDKLLIAKNETSEEMDFHQVRASAVEHGFGEVEGLLQARIGFAQSQGDNAEASRLKDMVVKVQRGDADFHEKYKKHIEAVQDGKGLTASKIVLEINENITDINNQLEASERTTHRSIEPLPLGDRKPRNIGPLQFGNRKPGNIESNFRECLDKPVFMDRGREISVSPSKPDLDCSNNFHSRHIRLPADEYALGKIPLYGSGDKNGNADGQLSKLPEDQRKLTEVPKPAPAGSLK